MKNLFNAARYIEGIVEPATYDVKDAPVAGGLWNVVYHKVERPLLIVLLNIRTGGSNE